MLSWVKKEKDLKNSKKSGKENLAPTQYTFSPLAMDKTSVWRIWGRSRLLDTFKHIHMVPFAASNLPHFGDTTNVKKAIFIIKFIIADVKLKKMIIVMIFVVITFSYP